MTLTNEQQLAESVRTACIKAALEAYEEGGVLGLCAKGRWEYAISTLQQLDLDAVLDCANADGGHHGAVTVHSPLPQAREGQG